MRPGRTAARLACAAQAVVDTGVAAQPYPARPMQRMAIAAAHEPE